MDKPENKRPINPAALNALILRSIVDHAIVTMDADGVVTSWNEGAERILGWTEDEIVGRSSSLFFTAVDAANNQPEKEFRLALENGRAEDVRWHVRKNGERFWGSGLMMPLLNETDDDGQATRDPKKIDGFVKIFRDRTSEREAEVRLARIEDRARLAMRRSGVVGIFDTDFGGGLVVSDEVCARMHSVPTDAAAAGTPIDRFFEKIVDEDRAATRAALDASARNGDDFDRTYGVVSPGRRPIWVQAQGTVQFDEDGSPAHLIGIAVDVSEQYEYARMKDAHLRFTDRVRDLRSPVEIAAFASRVIGETLYVTRAGHGHLDDDGDTIDIQADWCRPGGQSLVGQHRYSDFGSFAAVLRDGRDVIMPDVRIDPRVDNPEGLRALGIRALVNLPLMQGRVLKAVLFVHDAESREWTPAELAFLRDMLERAYAAIDRQKLEAERDVLNGELAHRMKNVLSIAQVIVTQSLRRGSEWEEERNSIVKRLDALARAQDILTGSQNKDADIHAIVDKILSPYIPMNRRVNAAGPSVMLGSQRVLGLSLALHELATNAAKYGALSNDTGSIDVSWSLDAGGFVFRWIEQDGPAVAAPAAKGFGSTILEQIVGNYFDGSSSLEFDGGGLRFSLHGQLDSNDDVRSGKPEKQTPG